MIIQKTVKLEMEIFEQKTTESFDTLDVSVFINVMFWLYDSTQ